MTRFYFFTKKVRISKYFDTDLLKVVPIHLFCKIKNYIRISSENSKPQKTIKSKLV